jgi:hypothetical protein
VQKLSIFVALLTALACVPEDPPDFRRSTVKAAATTARATTRRPDAKRRDAGPKDGTGPSSDGEILSAPFRDNFDRATLGADWNATSNAWQIQNGALCARDARNHPAWLLRRLPVNARIEFDATSNSPDGDLKVEVWGDGRSFATSTSYSNATSYILVFGGWKNSLHVLARLDEHKSDRLVIKIDPDSDDPREHPVSEGQTYHFKVERVDGATLRWSVDDIELHAFSDPEPLAGPGHEHLGFNDWSVPVCFDNLSVTPLED